MPPFDVYTTIARNSIDWTSARSQMMEISRRQREAMQARANALRAGQIIDSGDILYSGLRAEGDFVRGDLSNGSRLYIPAGKTALADVRLVYGAILARYAELGGAAGWLGGPLTDEQDFSEGGRVSVFQHGSIYWWPDTGAIELREVALRYCGLVCYGETDWDQGSDSDEPYIVFGTVGPQGGFATRSQVFEDVDGGESRGDWIELYRGHPTGLAVAVQLMEHDDDDPERYKAAMQAAVGTAFTGVTALIALIPAVGPIIAGIAGPIFAAVSPVLGAELNRLLDLQDDEIGRTTLTFSAKDMVLMAARAPYSEERGGIQFKRASDLISGEGASYKVYFAADPV